MEIKVCGMTNLDQLHQLQELDVKFAGFIFYPPSSRYVLKYGLTGAEVKSAKFKFAKVGVFVDATFDQIMKGIDDFGLDMIQLNGHETPFECSKISNYIDVIKAFRFAENDQVRWMIKDYYEVTNMFLFDTGIYPIKNKTDPNTFPKHSERKFNCKKLLGLDIKRSFFLSGGIDMNDVDQLKQFCEDPVAKDLFVVDINSRFEITPGLKDIGKIKVFVDELKSLSYSSRK